jgi:hypothetical protein
MKDTVFLQTDFSIQMGLITGTHKSRACKTGGFGESKNRCFNRLQMFWPQFIRLKQGQEQIGNKGDPHTDGDGDLHLLALLDFRVTGLVSIMSNKESAVQATTPPCERSRSSGFALRFDVGKTGSRTMTPATSKAFANEVRRLAVLLQPFQQEHS